MAGICEQKAMRGLVEIDWKYWEDAPLDVDGARIHVLGDYRASSQSLWEFNLQIAH